MPRAKHSAQSCAAERDLVALQVRSNAISSFIMGGFLGTITTFGLTKKGANAFETAPAFYIIGLIAITGIMLWAMYGRTAARPPRLQFTLDIGAAHTTAALIATVLVASMVNVGIGMPVNPVGFISYAPGIAAWNFAFVLGMGIGYFIWLGRYEAMFGVANLLAMLAMCWFASSPDSAINGLVTLGVVQFAIGVYLAKFQARAQARA